MVACPKCGREVEGGSYFCKYCGAALESSSKVESAPSELRGIVERRLNAIRNRDEGMLDDIMEESVYTKFDDWPPFNRQNSQEAMKNEMGAYKVLQKYNYELKDYREDVVGDTALATFHIHYWGAIRGRDFDVNSRVTPILRKSGQSWKVVHEHWSRFPETRPRRGLFG